MATFVQIGSLAALNTGYFNGSSIISIVFNATNTLAVSLVNPNTGADVVTLTLSSPDSTYETHRIIANALISATQSGSTYFQLPEILPGGRTVALAIG
jgi:hypothetical protein